MGDGYSDEKLMLAYADGDLRAFDTLYARNRGMLYRFILRSIADRASADELFQEFRIHVRNRGNHDVAIADCSAYRHGVSIKLEILYCVIGGEATSLPSGGATALHDEQCRADLRQLDPRRNSACAHLPAGAGYLTACGACKLGGTIGHQSGHQ